MVVWVVMGSLASAGSPVSDQMHERFQLLTEARDAVVRGDLHPARNWAGLLIDLEDDGALKKKNKQFMVQLRSAAAAIELARDLPSAAHALGQTAAACGACHTDLKRGPKLGMISEIPPPDWDQGENMLLHRWAMHWMWLGLIKGDDAAWTRGAKELTETPLEFRFGEEMPVYLQELEQRVYDLAGKALEARDVQRGPLMGQLIATCSECHQKLEAGPESPDAVPIEPEADSP